MARCVLCIFLAACFVPATLGMMLRATESAEQENRVARATAGAEKQKLFFLFMADDHLPNEELWETFLKPAAHGIDYEVLVHCENENSCRRNITRKKLYKLIPTVPSEWCNNLVGPMDALLASALEEGAGHNGDKFVFISDTTVPVKSFCEVRRRLINEGGERSNFCITAQDSWSWYKKSNVAIKHHQWVVLSRRDAATIVEKRQHGRDLLDDIAPLHWLGTTGIVPVIHAAEVMFHAPRLPKAWGCLDEYLYFALIHGYPDAETWRNGSSIPLPSLAGGQLLLRSPGSDDLQGQCDTYASFRQDGSNFTDLNYIFDADPGTKVARVERGLFGPLHPVRFEQLSKVSLGALHESGFLFARKVDTRTTTFDGSETLLEAFEKHAFKNCAA